MFYGNTFMGIDIWYLVLVLPAFAVALFAQARVKSTFNKFNRFRTMSGLTGAQAARRVLDANGLQHVRIEHVAGELTDHYDPQTNVIRLSDSTYGSASIASIGVAAHEAGHACQYAEEYGPIRFRMALVPVCNIGANLSWPAILLGYLFSMRPLVFIGIALFSLSVLFQLVTLPVEYNASSRALAAIDSSGLMSADELSGAKKVLSAAAMTYVAALAVSIANLLRLVLIFGRRSDRRD